MDKTTPISRVRCIRPFTSLELQDRGEVSFCCTEWVKTGSLGNLWQSSLEEIWNGPVARQIRQAFYEGRHEDVCKADVCPVLISESEKDIFAPQEKNTPFVLTQEIITDIAEGKTSMSQGPSYVLLANWDACNSGCIMCWPFRACYFASDSRRAVKKAKKEILKNLDAAIAKPLARDILKTFPSIRVLGLTGAGDPFFRPDTRELLLKKDKPKHLSIALFTNAALLNRRMWRKIAHNRFLYINVSVDAAEKRVYEYIRRFLKWEQVKKNILMLGSLRREGGFPLLILNFTVMRSNMDQILPFIELFADKGPDLIYFQRVRGNIANQENFFEGPDRDEDLLKKLEEIKKQALALALPGCNVQFGNL
ncbi:MAG: SPASM domain-containing protein [Desulfatibacillaceae bacterium]|nr:SPASM domain-containing protein [Desulfatibacillaceae bacterium]